MVKIKELTDDELIAQIEKYEKVMDRLYRERERRLEHSKESDIEFMFTESEKKEADQLAEQLENSGVYKLNFSDDEIQKIETNVKEEDEANKHKDDEDEDQIRVTQILRLTKEKLEKLKSKSLDELEAEAPKKEKDDDQGFKFSLNQDEEE